MVSSEIFYRTFQVEVLQHFVPVTRRFSQETSSFGMWNSFLRLIENRDDPSTLAKNT